MNNKKSNIGPNQRPDKTEMDKSSKTAVVILIIVLIVLIVVYSIMY